MSNNIKYLADIDGKILANINGQYYGAIPADEINEDAKYYVNNSEQYYIDNYGNYYVSGYILHDTPIKFIFKYCKPCIYDNNFNRYTAYIRKANGTYAKAKSYIGMLVPVAVAGLGVVNQVVAGSNDNV